MAAQISLLLVEDDELDVEAIRRQLRKQPVDADLRWAKEGAEALRLLREDDSAAESTAYTIVLLDLNMPGMNGHEFLAELRKDPRITRTIVFVLTSSDHQRDVSMAYDQHVAGYFLKSEVDSCMATICRYAEGVQYPPRG